MKGLSVNFFLPLLMFLSTGACKNQKKNASNMFVKMSNVPYEIDQDEKDARFLVSVAECLAIKIEYARLAQQNGQYDKVIALGKMMEEDHTRQLNELTELAVRKLITIPFSPRRWEQNELKELIKKRDCEFDEALCLLVVRSHQDTIGLFEKAELELSDPEIKAWVEKTLPAFRKHLAEAVTCHGKVESI